MSQFVGITMREAFLPERNEHRDCIEAGWWPFLEACGLVPICIPNHSGQARRLLASGQLRGVILSGGGDVARTPIDASERDRVEDIVLEHVQLQRLAVVGVCRGLQKLCVSNGGGLTARDGHTVTRHRISGGWGSREVNSYHDLSIDVMPGQYRVLAEADDGSPEWLAHEVLPVSGIMWHPERNDVPDQNDVALFRGAFANEGIH
jgi:putative glutamine amidotransferase